MESDGDEHNWLSFARRNGVSVNKEGLSSIKAVRAVETLEMLSHAVEPWSRGAVEPLEPSSCQAVEPSSRQAVEPSSR
jgi:hypothetical protein